METDTENETDTNIESDTESDLRTKANETENKQPISEAARKIVEEAKRLHVKPEHLRQKERNSTFNKVVIDYRCRESPRLLCCSDDVMVACDFETRQMSVIVKDPWNCNIYRSFYQFWPEVDREEHKEMIEKAWIEMKDVLNQVREII